jgi:hypothetical protein
VVGGVSGLLGVDDQPRFRSDVVEQRRPSCHLEGRVAVGVVLPERGITYDPVPEENHVQGYRYSIVDDTPVLVDPRPQIIVEVIECSRNRPKAGSSR